MKDDLQIESILSEQGSYIIYRAFSESLRKSVILKALADRDPRPEAFAALEHDFRIMQKISSDFVIKAHQLVTLPDGRMALVLDDIHGCCLATYLEENQYLDTDRFLEIALALAKSLRDIHDLHIIHKNICPQNIFYNPDTGHLKLVAFDIATELSRESQEINTKATLEGTLAYMSPEQTGRMNRFLDYRSDFYSLGATFYELLTGMTMFRAHDALGYVAAHISQTPLRVDRINKNVPGPLADIIEILTAKAPENRYQSSWGLICDLQKAQDSLKANGNIAPFTLKRHDISERFEIPQTLFGRDEQKSKLVKLFDEAAGGKAKLVVVRGESGIGKSALIHDVLRKMTCNSGFFLKGKHDQFCRNVPYYAIIQAFSSAVDQILRFTPEQFQQFATRLKDAVHPSGTIITNLMPDMRQIIGLQPQLQQLGPKEAQVVALRTISSFIQVFATAEHPLALFLDDMQWADRATLELLENLLASNQAQYLLIILSHRDNEVQAHHPLALSLEQIGKHLVIDTIDLGPLTPQHTTEMIAATLGRDLEATREIAQLVFQKTSGNPFYVEELLNGLFHDRLIKFNRGTGQWDWDVDAIRRIDASANIVEFLLKKLAALSAETKQALKVAACLGNTYSLSLLALALQKNPVMALQTLEEAIKYGLVIPLDRGYRLLSSMQQWDAQNILDLDCAFKFQHDRVQQAVYSLMNEEERQNTHLLIARTLCAQGDHPKIDLTEAARHYLESYTLIKDGDEKRRLIELNLKVAKKAIDANAYKQADSVIQAALHLMRELGTVESRPFARRAYLLATETAYQLNDIKAGDQLIETMLQDTYDQMERAEILSIKSAHLSSSGYLREAIQTSISSLQLLGYRFPGKVKETHVAMETVKLLVALSLHNPSRVLHAPKLTDRRLTIALKNFTLIGQSSFNLGDANAYALAFFKGAIITMKYGTSDVAAYFFAATAAVLMGIFKLVKLSRRLSELAIKLDETTEDLFLKSNCATILSCFNYFWHFDHKELGRHFNHCLQLAYQTGNNYYRAASAACYPHYMHEMELDKIYELSVKMESIAKEANSPQFCEALEIIRGGAANLLGITDSRFSLNYSGFNESRARKKVLASGNLMGLGGYTAVKTEVLVLRERWAEAVKVAWKGRWSILGVIATKYEMTYRFYKLLALTQYIPQLSGVRRWVHYLDAVAQRWILWLWSRDNPKGFAVYDAIASADFAALERKPLDVVLKKFEKAIAAGRAHSVKMHALACQRAYLFAKKHDLSDLAKVYLDHAIHHYNKWGATALADHLIKKHDPAFKGPTARAANLVGHAAGADAMVSANLDLDTIFKVSQAITKEVRLEKMTERLLEMLLENAGASRGLLVLAEEGQSPYIQAEIDTSSGLRELKPRTLDTDVLPAQIIQYILKSQKIVIISDQGSSDEFALDPYFKSRSPKAVLAAPILQQGKVLGVIYLENSATAHAFSLERNRMVELLAAQVATAIENSRLYRNLENTVAERTAEIQLILTNIEQGILSISGRSLKAHGEYSGHLGKILGHDDIADKTIEELLLNRAKLSITQKHAVLDCLRVAMGESVTVFLFNNHHLPKELLYKHRKESKVLEVDWTPIESGAGLVERILISLRDVTSLRSMEKEIAGKQRKIDLITQTLDLSGKQFSEYADQATQTCQECLDLIEEHSEANIRKIFIALHTQKGLAASLHLSFLVDEIHQAEGFYADAPTHGEAWSKEQARAGIEGIQRIIEEYRSVMHERLEGASATLQHKLESVERILADHFLDGRTRRTPQELAYALGVAILPGLQHLLAEQVKETQNVARHLHKNAPEIVFDKDICLFPLATSQLMRKVFVHLLRNSIDHGIESPAERAQAGKPASGRITIACELMSDILQITYRDDGRGVHLPSLRRAAMDGGFIDSASELSQAAIAELLFLPGFSTKNQLSRISGRGVGMSAVRDILCDAGCGITVHLGEEMQGYRSISFTLTVPCRMVVILHVDTKIAA